MLIIDFFGGTNKLTELLLGAFCLSVGRCSDGWWWHDERSVCVDVVSSVSSTTCGSARHGVASSSHRAHCSAVTAAASRQHWLHCMLL